MMMESKSFFPYRGFIWSFDSDCLIDSTHKSEEDSAFDSKQWYPGQPVNLPSDCMGKMDWSQGCKPPEKILRRFASSRSFPKFTVEKVYGYVLEDKNESHVLPCLRLSWTP